MKKLNIKAKTLTTMLIITLALTTTSMVYSYFVARVNSNQAITKNRFAIYIPNDNHIGYSLSNFRTLADAVNNGYTLDEDKTNEMCGDATIIWDRNTNTVSVETNTAVTCNFYLAEVDENNIAMTKDEADVLFNYEESNGEITILGLKGGNTPTELIIPSTIDGTPVTTIGGGAFYGCSSLTSIIIPNSVTSIGNNVFARCSSLTSIIIPDGVTSIGIYTFQNCSSLTSITIPDSVTTIGDSAFQNCSSLTSITIPNNVTSIGRYVFEGCSSLTSITIPNSVTRIGSSAFWSCNKLSTVNYRGTRDEWNAITIEDNDQPFARATIVYNYSGV